jgi:hypothetical protein
MRSCFTIIGEVIDKCTVFVGRKKRKLLADDVKAQSGSQHMDSFMLVFCPCCVDLFNFFKSGYFILIKVRNSRKNGQDMRMTKLLKGLESLIPSV